MSLYTGANQHLRKKRYLNRENVEFFCQFLVFIGGRYNPLEIHDAGHIVNGDNLGLLMAIGIDTIIFYTTGYARDSISVLLSDGSAIVGDAAMNRITYHEKG